MNQRTALQNKGATEEETNPHVLVMSATPIPRCLALILYGDLDISVISELPKGRKAVKTRIVPEEKREDMYGFLKKETSKNRQVYIVCPAVEDSETSDELRSAKTVFSNLKESCLKDLRIGLTWGGQKSAEKEQVLQDFRNAGAFCCRNTRKNWTFSANPMTDLLFPKRIWSCAVRET